MPLPRATSFKGVLSLAPWAMANFAPVSFWLLASTLRNAISPVQTLTSLPGWLLWSCHALGLWEYSKVDGVDVAGASDDRIAVESGLVGDCDRRADRQGRL